MLHIGSCKASVQIWSLAEVMAISLSGHARCYPPHALNLTRHSTMPPVLMVSNVLATALQELKNQGMHPGLAGGFGPPLSFDCEI